MLKLSTGSPSKVPLLHALIAMIAAKTVSASVILVVLSGWLGLFINCNVLSLFMGSL